MSMSSSHSSVILAANALNGLVGAGGSQILLILLFSTI